MYARSNKSACFLLCLGTKKNSSFRADYMTPFSWLFSRVLLKKNFIGYKIIIPGTWLVRSNYWNFINLPAQNPNVNASSWQEQSLKNLSEKNENCQIVSFFYRKLCVHQDSVFSRHVTVSLNTIYFVAPSWNQVKLMAILALKFIFSVFSPFVNFTKTILKGF